MKFPESTINLIKEKLTPRDYAISKGIQIDRNNKALCPFHDDHTPSLSFKDDYFKCFTCNTSGDVFSFIQQYEKIDFSEAVKIASGITGINIDDVSSYLKPTIKRESMKGKKTTNIEMPFIISDETKAIYREFYELLTPITKTYRVIEPETYERFKIKGIKDDRQVNNIKTELLKNHSLEALKLSGLFTGKGFLFYQPSIIFTYFENDEIIYFQGRVISQKQFLKLSGIKEPLYFGNLDCDKIYIFESIFDAVSFYQMTGDSNFVAVNRTIDGTAINQIKEKIPNLKKVICIFDNDTAGDNSRENLRKLNLEKVSFLTWETIFGAYEIEKDALFNGKPLKDYNDIIQYIQKNKASETTEPIKKEISNQLFYGFTIQEIRDLQSKIKIDYKRLLKQFPFILTEPEKASQTLKRITGKAKDELLILCVTNNHIYTEFTPIAEML